MVAYGAERQLVDVEVGTLTDAGVTGRCRSCGSVMLAMEQESSYFGMIWFDLGVLQV